ncbi:hypothetical protein [Allisonella histaminiformans]|uniref:hypothetical protein n=1 Tax=Allisonella histaminiformans TaxID=209880 RepID=UPI00352144C5
MRKQFNARAITLYDKKEDMVIGTLMLYKATEPIPWLPSNGILLFNGDGYSSDSGYTVIITVVNRETGWKVFVDGSGYFANIEAFE